MAARTTNATLITVGAITTMGFSANAADTYFSGAVVWADTGGGAQVTAAAGDKPIGLCPFNQVIAAAGDEVQVITTGIVGIPQSTLTAADELSLIGYDAGTLNDNFEDAVNLSGLTLADNDAILGKALRYKNGRLFVQLGTNTGLIFLAAQDVFW